jgi:hypothetical protein
MATCTLLRSKGRHKGERGAAPSKIVPIQSLTKSDFEHGADDVRRMLERAVARVSTLEFNEYRQIDAVFDFLQVWREARYECARRAADIFDEWSSGA